MAENNIDVSSVKLGGEDPVSIRLGKRHLGQKFSRHVHARPGSGQRPTLTRWLAEFENTKSALIRIEPRHREHAVL